MELVRNKEKIEKYFSHSSIEEILKSLEENKEDDFAKKTLENLKEKNLFILKNSKCCTSVLYIGQCKHTWNYNNVMQLKHRHS